MNSREVLSQPQEFHSATDDRRQFCAADRVGRDGPSRENLVRSLRPDRLEPE
jgi:hypothetical protein